MFSFRSFSFLSSSSFSFSRHLTCTVKIVIARTISPTGTKSTFKGKIREFSTIAFPETYDTKEISTILRHGLKQRAMLLMSNQLITGYSTLSYESSNHEPWTRASAARRPAPPPPSAAPAPPAGAPPPPPSTSAPPTTPFPPTKNHVRNKNIPPETLTNAAPTKKGRDLAGRVELLARGPLPLLRREVGKKEMRMNGGLGAGRLWKLLEGGSVTHAGEADVGDECEELQLQLRQRRRLRIHRGDAPFAFRSSFTLVC